MKDEIIVITTSALKSLIEEAIRKILNEKTFYPPSYEGKSKFITAQEVSASPKVDHLKLENTRTNF